MTVAAMKISTVLGGMAASASILACTTAFAQAGVPENGPSLRDLAPVQTYSVPDSDGAAPRALPPPGDDDAGSGLRIDAAAQADEQPEPLDLKGAWRPLRPTYAPGAWQPMGLDLLDDQTPSAGQTMAGLGWKLGSKNWNYTSAGGLGLTLGNASPTTPAWASSTTLGGVGLSKGLSPGNADTGQWQYATMVGALDYSPGTTEGGLDYGPAASTSVLRYGLSSNLTLESQMETAPAMKTMGLGGTYNTHQWGVWSAGVARASQEMDDGMRYQVGYQTSLLGRLQLSWVGEHRSAGFSDLSLYRNFADNEAQDSNLWKLTMPLGSYGDLSGSYQAIETPSGPPVEVFGVSHQFALNQNVKLALQAQRQRYTGDYDVGLQLSIPLN
ncbi:fimbria/pilus outer membrane usher protein [Candidimonas humi]